MQKMKISGKCDDISTRNSNVNSGKYITRDLLNLLFYEENGSVIFSETSGYNKVVDKEKWIKGEDYL